MKTMTSTSRSLIRPDSRRASSTGRAKVSSRRAGIKTMAICGLGLIGGSMVERLKQRRRAVRLLGYDKAAVLKSAKTARLVDSTTRSLKSVLEKSDLIVLSAPPSVNQNLLRQISQLRSTASPLIIDTGSMQSGIARLACELDWRNKATFVAAHPMAGREVQGLKNRQAALFDDHPFFFDRDVSLSDRQHRMLEWFTFSLGAYPLYVDNATHDAVMTDISQLPQILSTVIGSFVSHLDAKSLSLAGSGLQSMIRLGGSPYSNWRDVFAENQDYLTERLDELIWRLTQVRQNIASGESLAGEFKRAQRSYSCLW